MSDLPKKSDRLSAATAESSSRLNLPTESSSGVLPAVTVSTVSFSHVFWHHILWRAVCSVILCGLIVGLLYGFQEMATLDKWEKRAFNTLSILLVALFSICLGSLLEVLANTVRWPMLAKSKHASRDVSGIDPGPEPSARPTVFTSALIAGNLDPRDRQPDQASPVSHAPLQLGSDRMDPDHMAGSPASCLQRLAAPGHCFSGFHIRYRRTGRNPSPRHGLGLEEFSQRVKSVG